MAARAKSFLLIAVPSSMSMQMESTPNVMDFVIIFQLSPGI
jgi:hypothetical protein